MFITAQRPARWLIIASVGLLCLASLHVPTTALADTDLEIGGTAVVAYADGDDVRLRSAPGFDADVITMVREGTAVAVLEGPIEAEDGSLWYSVDADGTGGYIVSDFLAAGSAAAGNEQQITSSPSDTAEVNSATSAVVPASVGSGTTTSALNLRAGASTSDRVVLVIPAGSTVSLTGDAANGFLAVVYNGTTGWAYAAFLDTGDAAPDPDPGGSTGTAMTTTALNLRSGPSTTDAIIRVLPAGASVTLTGNSANGFLSISYDGVAGWAYAAYLDTGGTDPAPAPGSGDGNVRITSDLNLRSGPSTSNAVLAVMPAGSFITLTGDSANGFLSVSFNGISGWAYAAFLDTGNNEPPSTDPGAGEGPATTTTALNLRGGPGTGYPVLAVIPAGASVNTTGDPQDGFYPITFSGQAGWVAGAYLVFGGDPGGNPGGGSSGIAWPFAGGTWRVTQGYNGFSHYNGGGGWQYYYSLDLARADGGTAGQSVLSPVSGTIRWIDPSTGGMSIDIGNGYAVAFFHVTLAGGLAAGQSVAQGQYMGYISGPGGQGFVGAPHIHLTVWQTADGGNWSRIAVPFTGINAISGVEFPDIGGWNQHYGKLIYP